MRCLLDKVTARFTVQGLLKLAERRTPANDELVALDFFARAVPLNYTLFVAPPTVNVLQQLTRFPHYTTVIQLFLNRVEIAQPTRYFKRWGRRLRDYGFTPEDAAMLALTTFSTNRDKSILGMHYLVTFDQPMMNQWSRQQNIISHRMQAMQRDFQAPYSHVSLPQVLRPDQIE